MTTAARRPPWLSSPPDLGAANGTPGHVSIARWLAELIDRGDLVPGDRLPREVELAELLGVSRMTLRQALSTLESHGTLERKTGRTGGTFVREARIDCDLTGLAGFTEQMRRANLRAGARVVLADAVAANATWRVPWVCGAARPCTRSSACGTARREPLALERSYFPFEPFPDLLSQRLTGSLYGLLERVYGMGPDACGRGAGAGHRPAHRRRRSCGSRSRCR